MKRLLGAVLAAALLVTAAAFSGNLNQTVPDLQIQGESRNPWTHLRLNNDPSDFQFAIVSDRTGGHRPRIFSQAVEQLNLLQPEFVLSVGDLIEGYSKDPEKVAGEWREFQSYVCKLQMPFFYVPGNHDISNLFMEQLWKEKFGRHYYHFTYRNVLFLILNSDDPPEKEGHISEEQVAYVKKALEENANIRWTIVALHKPLWAQPNIEKTGWLEVEKALAGRPYTVFAGHIHRYQKFVRNGQRYYQLATTGGDSKMRGTRYNEFDHIVWVTMKKEGPVLANILLDGIYSEDLKQPVTAEAGVIETNRKPTHPVRGKVFFDGCPIPNAQVVFYAIEADKRFRRTADGLVEPDGTFTLSSYRAHDGVPVGNYAVTVIWRDPPDELGRPGPNRLPERYGKPDTSPLTVAIREGVNEVMLELKK